MMGGVDPHELSPIVVGQSVDEWIVIQAPVKAIGFSTCRDALFDNCWIFA